MSNKNILQQLFDGEIYPAENAGGSNPKYQKFINTLSDKKEQFLQTLTANNQELYREVENLQYDSCEIYSYECFVHGFCLGVKLMIEALGDIAQDR